MSTHRFSEVDVFADGAFTGNPVAVVHDADDLDTEAMQHLTRWTNLSEAAFLLAPTNPDADYRVRIFEPKHELPFAGHPTLGACAAWLAAGGVTRDADEIVQECGAGLVRLRRTADGLEFAAPPMIRHEPIVAADLDRALQALGLDSTDVVASHWIDNGPGWMGLQLVDAASVLAIEPPTGRYDHFDVGVVGLYSSGARDHGDGDIEVRAFFNDPNGSIREDPVTGSVNASIAQWLIGTGALPRRYTARQNTGRVTISEDEGTIWVGGVADVRVSGTVEL